MQKQRKGDWSTLMLGTSWCKPESWHIFGNPLQALQASPGLFSRNPTLGAVAPHSIRSSWGAKPGHRNAAHKAHNARALALKNDTLAPLGSLGHLPSTSSNIHGWPVTLAASHVLGECEWM